MDCDIQFPSNWVSGSSMEKTLNNGPSPHECDASIITFTFPIGCKVMIDAAVRLLSFFNQLASCSRRVRLVFEEGYDGAMGYLDRMGFFDNLSRDVEVTPSRPIISGASIHGGQNNTLVEIARIDHKDRDKHRGLVTRLIEALMQPCSSRADAEELKGTAWTIFSELIDNIFEHSDTPIDGYAALQYYPGGQRLTVAVSDSGRGIMETLRPALQSESPKLAALEDVDLMVEIFRQGLSRHGEDRGCGLKGSAAKAIKFNASLDIRLPDIRIELVPGRQGYRPNKTYCSTGLPLIWGTHICFNFALDT